MRSNNRTSDQLRAITFTRHYTKHAEGSVLVEFGDTKVLCNASFVNGVPRFLKGTGQGWMTAEYGMLPRATQERTDREASRGKQGGRTLEIQRLIGRALRTAIHLPSLGENTLTLDCDVIQADGGTRTAAITGGFVAMADACHYLVQKKKIKKNPLKYLMAAVSVGIQNGVPLLDLDYNEDSTAETDMNVIITEHGDFIEIQGTAEKTAFKQHDLDAMLTLAKKGVAELIVKQKEVMGDFDLFSSR